METQTVPEPVELGTLAQEQPASAGEPGHPTWDPELLGDDVESDVYQEEQETPQVAQEPAAAPAPEIDLEAKNKALWAQKQRAESRYNQLQQELADMKRRFEDQGGKMDRLVGYVEEQQQMQARLRAAEQVPDPTNDAPGYFRHQLRQEIAQELTPAQEKILERLERQEARWQTLEQQQEQQQMAAAVASAWQQLEAQMSHARQVRPEVAADIDGYLMEALERASMSGLDESSAARLVLQSFVGWVDTANRSGMSLTDAWAHARNIPAGAPAPSQQQYPAAPATAGAPVTPQSSVQRARAQAPAQVPAGTSPGVGASSPMHALAAGILSGKVDDATFDRTVEKIASSRGVPTEEVEEELDRLVATLAEATAA